MKTFQVPSGPPDPALLSMVSVYPSYIYSHQLTTSYNDKTNRDTMTEFPSYSAKLINAIYST